MVEEPSMTDGYYEWKGSRWEGNVMECICKDMLMYSGIPTNTSDETPVCSIPDKAKEGNGNYCNEHVSCYIT
jgi:hypothetical protein